jgi:DNA-binding beta-propeller fold protein YncE
MAGASGVTVAPDGRFVYAAATRSEALTVFARDGLTGALRQLPGRAGCVRHGGRGRCSRGRALVNAVSIALSPDGRNAYSAASLLSHAVGVFERDPVSGRLRQLAGRAGCLTPDGDQGCGRGRGLLGAAEVVVSPTGSDVYATAFDSNAVARFRRDRTSGRLRQPDGRGGCVSLGRAERCATARGLANATGVAISPDGRTVYAAGSEQNAVVALTRSRRTGRLSPLGCNALSLRGCTPARGLEFPFDIAISPDGRNVYVTSLDDDAIAVFARG